MTSAQEGEYLTRDSILLLLSQMKISLFLLEKPTRYQSQVKVHQKMLSLSLT